jgi:hypothetical protein
MTRQQRSICDVSSERAVAWVWSGAQLTMPPPPHSRHCLSGGISYASAAMSGCCVPGGSSVTACAAPPRPVTTPAATLATVATKAPRRELPWPSGGHGSAAATAGASVRMTWVLRHPGHRKARWPWVSRCCGGFCITVDPHDAQTALGSCMLRGTAIAPVAPANCRRQIADACSRAVMRRSNTQTFIRMQENCWLRSRLVNWQRAAECCCAICARRPTFVGVTTSTLARSKAHLWLHGSR